jgi:N,N'-diacetyl-8-epilegionaminate cytidylyltransferase
MKIIVFIFARGGSKGLKNKNLLKINGKSLLGHSITQAKKIKFIKKIFVSTDSTKIKKEALKFGAEVPFKRPKKLATNKSPEYLSWRHAVNYLKNKMNIKPDFIVSLPTTSPLRKKQDIQKCINLAKKKNLDLVLGITKSSKNPFFNIMIKKNNKYFKFSDLLTRKFQEKKLIFRRQDAPKTYDLTTVCYVFKPSYVIRSKNMFSGKIGYVEIPKERSIDIDDVLDLKIAKLLLKK